MSDDTHVDCPHGGYDKAEGGCPVCEDIVAAARECPDRIWLQIEHDGERVAALTEHVDLMADEFQRIAACPGVTDEIRDLCARALATTRQKVPLLVQRDDAIRQRDALAAKLRQADADWNLVNAEKNAALARVDAAESRAAAVAEPCTAPAPSAMATGDAAVCARCGSSVACDACFTPYVIPPRATPPAAPAAVTEAMVEAAAVVLWEQSGVDDECVWSEAHPESQGETRQLAERMLQAVLAAAASAERGEGRSRRRMENP